MDLEELSNIKNLKIKIEKTISLYQVLFNLFCAEYVNPFATEDDKIRYNLFKYFIDDPRKKCKTLFDLYLIFEKDNFKYIYYYVKIFFLIVKNNLSLSGLSIENEAGKLLELEKKVFTYVFKEFLDKDFCPKKFENYEKSNLSAVDVQRLLQEFEFKKRLKVLEVERTKYY